MGRRSDSETPGDAGAVRSVDRALLLLEAVARSTAGAPLSELARETGLAASTTHRLLIALQERSFLTCDRASGLWRVGRSALGVGAAFAGTRDMVAVARPLMKRAAQDCGEIINLGVIDDGHVTFLYRVDPRARRDYVPPPVNRLPAHCSSIGKALLSYLPERETRSHVEERPLAALTERTLVSPLALRAQFEGVRRCGFAIDDEENTQGLRCLAASIFDEYHRPVAALSLAAPVARLNSEQTAQSGAMIAAMARDLSLRWSGTAP